MIDATSPHSFAVFRTDLGWMGARLGKSGIKSLTFGHLTEESAWESLEVSQRERAFPPPAWWKDAHNLLVEYASGEPVDLTQIPVEAGEKTAFQQRVVYQLQKVPYGQVVTYRELAARAGSPGAARAVGNQMAKNCLPLIIPCHRVIGSGGKLGGFSAPQGLDMKRHLLSMEGCSPDSFAAAADSPTSSLVFT
ncbi:Methylated-DNA--protein-cysteine methyltransferase [Thalassoglobus neptunius]|uniref:methylated-DNA--[protein]-cysteine S-methyltransferase n=1 Tax=Thalassoglobus neptunius TaxID=1938619 RepID=A0A5C5X1Z2_9PLAN|nr:methylated-DNA--[protein]-cysteine S-methyltransferase [Thalassoglobus neptunius]TWT57047.1 Methylated-DNA--protein-cysteine methyltransferase [Thalassoglobus neptunius]